jgi:hypothetical protein
MPEGVNLTKGLVSICKNVKMNHPVQLIYANTFFKKETKSLAQGQQERSLEGISGMARPHITGSRVMQRF